MARATLWTPDARCYHETCDRAAAIDLPHMAAIASLAEEQRARLLARLSNRLDGEGRLRVVASESRSQLRNREAATERLRELVAAALAVRKPRKRTKPGRAAKAARLEAKRRRSALKRDRRRPRHDE